MYGRLHQALVLILGITVLGLLGACGSRASVAGAPPGLLLTPTPAPAPRSSSPASPTPQPARLVSRTVATVPYEQNTTVAWAPDGTSVATCDGLGARLTRPDGTTLATLTPSTGPEYRHCVRLAWSPNGAVLAVGDNDGNVELWGADHTHRATLTVEQASRAAVWLAWAPDSARLVTASSRPSGTAIQLWSTAGSLVATLPHAERTNITALTWSPDGATIVVATVRGTLQLWEPDGTFRATVAVPEGLGIGRVAWAPHGDRLAVSSATPPDAGGACATHLYDPSGAVLATLTGGETCGDLAWSPDGAILATGGRDGVVRLWNAQGTLQATLRGHTAPVFQVAWSPDGRTLASGSDDLTVRLWQVTEDAALAVLTGHTGAIAGLAWSPDGTTLASASDDGTVRLWR